MRTSAAGLGALMMVVACGPTPKPDIVYRTKEVPVEVPVMCPIELVEIEGPDFAPADSNIEFAAIYAEGRIIALRRNNEQLREAIQACEAAVEE